MTLALFGPGAPRDGREVREELRLAVWEVRRVDDGVAGVHAGTLARAAGYQWNLSKMARPTQLDDTTIFSRGPKSL